MLCTLLLPCWCEGLGPFTVLARMLVLTCLLTPFVSIVSLDFCRSVPVLRPPAVPPRADSGTATKPLTWMVSSARLIGCTRCWRPRLRLCWWLSLISCTRCWRAAALSLAAETDQLHTESESSGARVCWHPGGHSARRGRVGGLRLRGQAHSRLGNFVVDPLSSSHHVDQDQTRNVGCAHGEHNLHDARTNSCLGHTCCTREFTGFAHYTRKFRGHANSYRCTYNSCGGVWGGTKPMSMSTLCQDRCPAVEKLASLQQAPGRLHVETWAGRDGNPSLPISQVVEIMPGCSNMVTCLHPPLFSSVSPGPGREVRNGVGWSLMEKTARSGVWLFRGALRGTSAVFAFAAFANCVKKGSFLTAWAVSPLSSCSCSFLYGRGTAVGPQSGERVLRGRFQPPRT